MCLNQQTFIIFQFPKQETLLEVSMVLLLKAQGRSFLPPSIRPSVVPLQLVDTLFQYLPVSRDHLPGFVSASCFSPLR